MRKRAETMNKNVIWSHCLVLKMSDETLLQGISLKKNE